MNEEMKLEYGNRENFYSEDKNNNFCIAFDKIFKQSKLEVFNAFEMNSKRNFKNLTPSIVDTYRELFLKDGKFDEDLAIVLFNILNVKSKLMLNETSYEEFLSIADSITDSNDSLLIKKIGDYVEEHYALDLDTITANTKAKKKKVNEELQFSDEHARSLLKIAYLYRVMIPIISVYFTYNKSLFAKTTEDIENDDLEDMKFDEINGSIFAYLFEKFEANTGALRNKLYKLVYSRVSRTSYSDKRFWQAAKNQGITQDTETLEIYKKLLTNAIPKLSIDGDKNIVSFFQSVVNNQIDFLFQNKFKNKYISLGNNEEKYRDDDDATSEFERLEIQMLRKDEGLFVIRKLNIEQTLANIPKYFEVEVTDTEVLAEVKTLTRHAIQEKIIAMLTYKYFDDKQAIRFLSFYQYVFLVIATRKYLEKHKFKILPEILTANMKKHKERTNISGKRIRPMIQESKKYKELFTKKYINFEEEIEKPLSAIIGTVYSSVFTDFDGQELFDSTVKVGKVADELIDMISLI
jgi:hypothetical protein